MPVNTPYLGSRLTSDFHSNVSFAQDIFVQGNSDFSGNIDQRVAASTVTMAGAVISTGTIDMNATAPATSGVFLSRFTSASPTSLVLGDGELAVTAVSVTSVVLAFRSGVTTYQIIADVASVL